MNKGEFLAKLRNGLSGLPQDEIEERLTFYSEMLDDRMEEGLSEEAAVAAAGDVEEIVRQTVADTPLVKIAKERMRPKRQLKVWEIVLLTLGSPIWLSLGIAAFAVVFSLYVAVWAVIVSLWAVFAVFVGVGVGSVPMCVILATDGGAAAGLAILAAGLVCAGLSIFMFYGCKQTTKGICVLTKKAALGIKNSFIKKGEA